MFKTSNRTFGFLVCLLPLVIAGFAIYVSVTPSSMASPRVTNLPISTTADETRIGISALLSSTQHAYLPLVIKGSAPVCASPGTYDDTASSIAYNGNWQLYTGTGPYNSTLHYSDINGETAQFVFCGGRVTVVYASNTNGGALNVTIDGQPTGSINEYSSSLQWQQQWVSGQLSNGSHLLTLTHTGSARVNVDAIIVAPPAPPPSSICVSVYYDMNGNQIFDPSEPLLRGAGVRVTNSSNVVVGSFVSNDTNARCLTDLPAGTYTVTEYVNTPSFALTTPDTQLASVTAGNSSNVYFGDSVSQPNGMVADTSRNHLYVTSKNTGWLLAWDETDNRILTTVWVGSQPWGVGLLNDRVFVAEWNSQVVAVIDAATQARIQDIDLAPICPGGPAHVAVNPNTNQVYVSIYSSPGRIAVIDAAALNVSCITLTGGDGAFDVAVNPSLNQLYVTSRDSNSLQVFDVSTVPGSWRQTVTLGGSPFSVQTKPSTNQVYVAVALDAPVYENANTLQAYYATAAGITLPLTRTATISDTHDGGAIWVSRKNGNLYIAATDANVVQIIHPVTLAILQTISMPSPSAITEDDKMVPGRMYIANRDANLITIISDNLP